MPDWKRRAIGGAGNFLVGMALGRFSYTLMVAPLIEGGSLSPEQAGYVGSFNLLGYLVGIPLAAWLVGRMGDIRALKICLVISFVCLIASIPPWGFTWLAFWRFLVGASMAVMMIYSLTVVNRAAPRDKVGAAAGIVFTGVGIGNFASGVLVPLLLETSLAAAWTGLAVIGGLGTIVGLWGWGGATSSTATDQTPPKPAANPRVSDLSLPVFRLYIAQTMFSLGLIPPFIYWVDYAVRGLGHDLSFGGMLWVLFGLGAAMATYLWGWLADRIGLHHGLALVLAVLAVGVAAPVLHPTSWVLIVASLVVGTQPGFSAIISGRTLEVVGPDHMVRVWSRIILISGIAQAAGGFAYVALFNVMQNYLPLFLLGGLAMGVGALVSLQWGRVK